MKRWVSSLVASAIVIAAMPAAAAAHRGGGHDPDQQDVARYILPPGNYGGIPFTTNSTDQLPLYSGLTPLRDKVTSDDINRLYLPEDFQPIGQTHEEPTGRPGLRLIYDSYGIPHIYGQTRADVAFGAGWAIARDRSLLLTLGRGAGAGRGRRRPQPRRLQPGDQRADVRAERLHRGAGHPSAEAPRRYLRG